MTRALVLVCISSAGCLVVPATKSTTHPLDNELGAPTFKAGPDVSLEATAHGNGVTVTAIRAGQCTRPVFARTEITSDKHAKLGGSDDPRAMIFGVLLAPVTIPISAVITGIIVASDSAETRQESKQIATQTYACTLVAAKLPIQMTLPSGGVVHGITDLNGTAILAVPTSEPYTGSVSLAAAGAKETPFPYTLPRPPFIAARDAVTECAAKQAITGSVMVKLSIDDDGAATHVWLSAGDQQVQSCVEQQLTGVRFPDKAHGRTVKMPLSI